MRRHPRVYLPERRKEVHFFDLHHARGPGWYAGFFPDGDAARRYGAIGEVTPSYLFDPAVPARVGALLPDARLIAILRDPVERCRSHHGLAVRDAAEGRPLDAYLEANPEVIERGFYGRQLARFLARFPRERVLVLIHERAVRDPAATARSLASFLGVDAAAFMGAPPPGRLNASYRPRFPRLRAAAVRLSVALRDADRDRWVALARRLGAARWFGTRPEPLPAVPAELRHRLEGLYAADRRQLEGLLGFELAEWRSG